LWAGNETDEELKLDSMELAGFNTGSFEEKAVAGALTLTKSHFQPIFSPFNFAARVLSSSEGLRPMAEPSVECVCTWYE